MYRTSIPWCIKGEQFSFLPNISPAVKLFTTFICVYITLVINYQCNPYTCHYTRFSVSGIKVCLWCQHYKHINLHLPSGHNIVHTHHNTNLSLKVHSYPPSVFTYNWPQYSVTFEHSVTVYTYNYRLCCVMENTEIWFADTRNKVTFMFA